MARILCAVLLFVAQSAVAVDILVDTTDGTGNTGDGSCSLIEALTAANTNTAVDGCVAGSFTASDTIVFDDAIFNLAGLATVIPNTTLSIGTGDLRIVGPSDKTLTISGNGVRRVLLVDQAVGNQLEIRNLTIRDGLSPGFAGNGGGMEVQDGTGSLILANVDFINNTAEASGGALHISSDDPITVSITGSMFETNSADSLGGAIAALDAGSVTLTVSGSHFLTNSAAAGGAVYVRNNAAGSSATLNIFASVFEGNTCTLSGAAVRFADLTADVSSFAVTSSRFTSNIAEGGAGGAITASQDPEDTLTISRSSFVQNDAYQAGAIFTSGQRVTLENNSFIQNTADEYTGGVIVQSTTASLTANTFYRNQAMAPSTIGSFQVSDLFIAQQTADGGVQLRGNLFDSLTAGSPPCELQGSAMMYSTAYNLANSTECLITDGTSVLSNTLMLALTMAAHPVHEEIIRPDPASPGVDFIPTAQCVDEPAMLPLLLDMVSDRRDSSGVPWNGNAATPTGCDAGAIELIDLLFSDGFE